jgi:hypothetical protein
LPRVPLRLGSAGSATVPLSVISPLRFSVSFLSRLLIDSGPWSSQAVLPGIWRSINPLIEL